MNSKFSAVQRVSQFQEYLINEEKSTVTVEKYLRDTRAFLCFVQSADITKELVMAYKQHLIEKNYAVASINSMLAGINCFLDFCGYSDCKVKNIRQQRKVYCPEEKELSKAEYLRLLTAAGEQSQLSLILQTICGTGIRISELKYFQVEAVKRGEINVQCKSKTRVILVSGKLRKKLLDYAEKRGITAGPIFITRNGNAVNRSNIWAQMKRLCKKARVATTKVFPHNLRKLFARTFYSIDKDIAKLADLLGHGSIETTRIYIMTTGTEHRKQIEQMGLVL